jgi:isopentenyl diphosphate isomerase/L-lactate dehydrogenase-like FMN-dependent dehydrogenase
VLWGLAAGGQSGVHRALEMIRAELELSMALAGCPNIGSIGSGLIARP